MCSHISRNVEIMGGVPCFTGTRVPIQNLFDYLESASSLDDFLKDFPTVSLDAAVAVLEDAKRSLLDNAAADHRIELSMGSRVRGNDGLEQADFC
jgi:uncharacterized protein (DUF433 family)